MTFIPQYGISSVKVLIGTVGGGDITAGSHNLGPVGFTPLPGRLTADYFTAADVGRIVTVLGAGPSGGILIAKITSVTDTQHIVLDTAASTTVGSGVSAVTVFRPLVIQAGSLSYDNSITDGMQAGFISEQLAGEFPPVAGQQFLFTSTDPSVGDAWGTFAGGEIDSVETSNITGNVGSLSTCHCVSYKVVLQRRTMLGKTYSSTTQQTIAADIAAQATTDCIGLVTVTGPSVPMFTVADYTYLDAALDDLIRNINNSTDTYFYYVDQWRRVVLANQTTTPAPWSVSMSGGTDGNVRVSVSVASSRDKLANQRYLKATKALGDPVTTVFANTFNGAPLPIARRGLTLPQKSGIVPSIAVTSLGAQRVWVCPTDPRNDSLAVTIPVGYDWAWPIDSDYLFCDGSRPGIPTGQSGTVTYRVAFEAISPYLQVSSVSERSAIEGGSGLHEVVESIDVPVIKTELDAMAQSSTEASSVPPSSVTVQSFRGGLMAGQGLTVNLTDIGAVVNYLVESVTLAEENGWVRWDIKASVGALVGGYLKALSAAFDPRPSGVSGGVRNITGSVLAVLFGGSGACFVDSNYSAALLASGGLAPYTYGIASGSLPTGCTLNSTTGIISGTPSISASFTFVGSVIDANGTVADTPSIVIAVDPQPSGGENIGTATGLTASETGTVYEDTAGAIHLSVQFVCAITAVAFPVRTRCWIDFDDGRGAVLLGDRDASASTSTFIFGALEQRTGLNAVPGDIYVPVDPAKIHWKGYIECNSVNDLPTLAAKEDDFDVTPAQAVPNGDVTNIQFVNNDLGDPIDYATDNVTQYWIPHEIDAILPSFESSPYMKSTFMTVQSGYSTTGTVTVSGGVNCTLTSGTIVAGDAGMLVYISGIPFRILAYVNATHFTIKAAAAGMSSTSANGSGKTFELWRNSPHDTFFGDSGDDDFRAYDQGYWGRRFTDGPGPQSGSVSTSVYTGKAEWDIIPPEYNDGTANPYSLHHFWFWTISRLADNQAGGGAETISLQTGWVTGKPYGELHAVMQNHPLDLRNVGRAKSFADSSIVGGDGVKHKANLGYTTYLDGSGQIAVKNLKNFSSLPTLPSADYEAGSVVRLSTTGKLYRTDGFSWALSTDPADLAAGALAGGVTLNASQVNAGTFNGLQLILNLNGITTSITNQSLSNPTLGVATTTGLKSIDNSTGSYVGLSPDFLVGWDVPSSIGYLLTKASLSFSNSGGQVIRIDQGGTPGLYVNNILSASVRRAGPGNPSGWADATAQSWAQSLLTALRSYGCLS